MATYDRPTTELMKEFVATLRRGQVITRSDVKAWFKRHYPRVAERTVDVNVDVMTVNAPARLVHRAARPGLGSDLLFRIGLGEYRLYEIGRDPPPLYTTRYPDPAATDQRALIAAPINQQWQDGKIAKSETWIFQSNPYRFDIDGYLKQNNGELSWLVTRHKSDIKVGDTVYLWRSGNDSGVVGEAEVVGPVERRADDPEALPFWAHGDDSGTELADRVRLRLRRIASRKREVIRRDWLKEDHELRELSIVKMPTGTNFRVDPELAPRLAAIWSTLGQNWSYAEVVAALWAYVQVWDKAISKSKGSPVDQVSRLINRVIPGVYNKLMNLRALDERVDAAGLAGGSKTDEQVWTEFYDASTRSIRTDDLAERFRELWGSAEMARAPLPEESAVREELDQEVRRLDKALTGRTLEELMSVYRAQAKRDRPRRRPTRTNAFERNALVVLITKRRAAFKCEVATCSVPPFVDKDNQPYVETHHLVPLAEGGRDTIDNTACLCAVHHRELHCGKARMALTKTLQDMRANKAKGLHSRQ